MARRKSIYDKVWAGDYIYGVLVLEKLYYPKQQQYGALFRCHCGKSFERTFFNVKRGGKTCESCTKSRVYSGKYDIKDRRLYRIWKAMNHRCHNPEDPNFEHYGGRGIKVCDDWRDTSDQGFNNFYHQMGIYPTTNHTIDRLDVDGNYCPENCEWKTQKEQMNNVRRNHILVWKGEEYTLQKLGEELGIKPNTILTRLRRGYSLEEAVKQKPSVKRVKDKDGKDVLEERGSYQGSLKDRIPEIDCMVDQGMSLVAIAESVNSSVDIVGRIVRDFLKKDFSKQLSTYNGVRVKVKTSFKWSQGDLNILFEEKDKGSTNTKIAKMLGCSNSTVTKLIRRFYDKS